MIALFTSTPARLAWRLGLWALASWLVLRLHDSTFAGEHTICGPWGCGPTIPALVAAHGFWLVTLLPLAIWGRRSLSPPLAILMGRVLLGASAVGIATVAAWEFAHWPFQQAEFRPYTLQHVLFSLATLVDVPLFQGALAGLILAGTRRREVAAGAIGGCGDHSCGLDDAGEGVAPAPGRLEVGRPFPRMDLAISEDRTITIPGDRPGRATVLYFMRNPGCSICRGHVRRFAEKAAELDALGADVVIAHPGDFRASRALEKSLAPGLPIVAHCDPDDLGSKPRPRGFRTCGTLLIDDRGVIRSARLSRLPQRGYREADLLADLREITPGGEWRLATAQPKAQLEPS